MTIVILFDSYPFILIFDFNRRSLNEILVENEEWKRFHRQRREEDRDPVFERVDNFTTVLRYPNMPNDTIGPLFNYRNEV